MKILNNVNEPNNKLHSLLPNKKNSRIAARKTNFLLAGDNMGPEKLKKAEKLGVKIISEDDFLEMIK